MKNQQRNQRGFTLFIAVIITGTLLLIASAIVSLAVRQALISTASRESQHAFYAADTGMECALYWDVQNPAGISAFATPTSSNIFCNRDGNNPGNQWTVGGGGANGTSTFSFTMSPDSYCATVAVNKKYVPFPTTPASVIRTTIESKGHNTCSALNPRRVERAVRAIY